MLFRQFGYLSPDGDAGSPAGGTPAVGAPAVDNAAGSAPAPAPVWFESYDADTKGYIQTKGFKEPLDVLTGYRNLEKLRGVPADRLITLPEKTDDAVAMRAVFEKLGTPKVASEYNFDKTTTDALAPEFHTKAAEWFHKIGVPAKMAAELVKTLNEDVKANKATMEAQRNQKSAAQQDTLKKDWGGGFDKNLSTATGAAKMLGWSKETIDSLESALGYDGVLKLLHDVGVKFGEDKFATGSTHTNSTPTADTAKNEIAMLKQDKEFMRKATDSTQPGHADAKRKLTELHQIAFPAV